MGVFLRALLVWVVIMTASLLPARVAAADARAARCNNRGVDLYVAGKYEQALQSYDEAIRLNPKYTEAYSNRGAAFDALNNPARAVQDYSCAIRLSPKLTAAYSNRAAAYSDLGDFEKAVDDWTTVVRRTPRDAAAYNGRGTCYKALGNFEAALKDFEKAVALKPHYTKAAANRDAVRQSLSAGVSDADAAAHAVAHNNNTSAHPIADKPVKPTLPSAGRPSVTAADGQPAQTAVKTRESPVQAPALAKLPTQTTPKLRTINTQAQTQTATTTSAGDRLHSQLPAPLAGADNVLHHILGNIANACGQYPAAVSQFTDALADNPSDAFAYFRRGNAYKGIGLKELALADYEAAIHFSPHFTSAYLKRDRLRSDMSGQGSKEKR